MVSAVDVVKA